MRKTDLRKILLEARKSHHPLHKARKDAAILRKIKRMPQFKAAKEFFTYLSHAGEVDTDFLIKEFFGKKKILAPKIKQKHICLYEIQDPHEFEVGIFGIREPKICIRREQYKDIDLVFVPGIAFDKTGHRIGYGGGYFDKFLKKLHSTTIGLAYEFQIVDKILTHKYDMPVNFIVTEKRVIDCKKNKGHPELVPPKRDRAEALISGSSRK